MTPAEILRAAKAKIADPKNWCQGADARDVNGREVVAESIRACRWCALGAPAREALCLGDLKTVTAFLNWAAEEAGYHDNGPGSLPAADLNDTTDHATVMALYDRAIELAEAEAS